MEEHSIVFVDLDVSKDGHAVAVAEGGRDGDMRYLAEIAWAGDEFHHGSPGRDARDLPKARYMYDPHRHIDELRIKPRDLR